MEAKEKLLVDAPRDAVGALAAQYARLAREIDQRREALSQTTELLIVELHKARRQQISIQLEDGRITTMEIVVVPGKEKIRIVK